MPNRLKYPLLTDEEGGRADLLDSKGKGYRMIARILGVDFSAVRTYFARKEKAYKSAGSKPRKCLECGRMFESSWAGNRICSAHRKDEREDVVYHTLNFTK